MDINILDVINFPKELLGHDIIRDKETQETYINKKVFGEFVVNFINEKGFKFTEQDMFEFADWYCNGLLNIEREVPEKMLPQYLKIKGK